MARSGYSLMCAKSQLTDYGTVPDSAPVLYGTVPTSVHNTDYGTISGQRSLCTGCCLSLCTVRIALSQVYFPLARSMHESPANLWYGSVASRAD